jgi:hypothetical protein
MRRAAVCGNGLASYLACLVQTGIEVCLEQISVFAGTIVLFGRETLVDVWCTSCPESGYGLLKE